MLNNDIYTYINDSMPVKVGESRGSFFFDILICTDGTFQDRCLHLGDTDLMKFKDYALCKYMLHPKDIPSGK